MNVDFVTHSSCQFATLYSGPVFKLLFLYFFRFQDINFRYLFAREKRNDKEHKQLVFCLPLGEKKKTRSSNSGIQENLSLLSWASAIVTNKSRDHKQE